MSHDISLCDPVSGKVLELDGPHQMTVGTCCLGGTNEARLNVTYNYSRHYFPILGEKGICVICGMSGADNIPILENAISRLGDDVSDDYWEATEGNAKRALLQLLAFARLRPDGVWEGD